MLGYTFYLLHKAATRSKSVHLRFQHAIRQANHGEGYSSWARLPFVVAPRVNSNLLAAQAQIAMLQPPHSQWIKYHQGASDKRHHLKCHAWIWWCWGTSGHQPYRATNESSKGVDTPKVLAPSNPTLRRFLTHKSLMISFLRGSCPLGFIAERHQQKWTRKRLPS